MVIKANENINQAEENRSLGGSFYTPIDEMGFRFRPQIFFDTEDTGGSSNSDDDDNSNNDDNDDNDNNNDNNSNNDNDDDKDKDIETLKKEHKKELDRYRNDIGQLKKEFKELQEKGMTKEEKLDAREKEMQEKEQELRVKELEAHKSQQIAEQELDKRLADYIKVNAEKSEDDITGDIEKLKSAVDAIVQERIEKMQESGSVLNGFNFNSNKKNSKTSIGKELAKFNKENNKGATEAQKNYFGE